VPGFSAVENLFSSDLLLAYGLNEDEGQLINDMVLKQPIVTVPEN
jgi:hypothetical protein